MGRYLTSMLPSKTGVPKSRDTKKLLDSNIASHVLQKKLMDPNIASHVLRNYWFRTYVDWSINQSIYLNKSGLCSLVSESIQANSSFEGKQLKTKTLFSWVACSRNTQNDIEPRIVAAGAARNPTPTNGLDSATVQRRYLNVNKRTWTRNWKTGTEKKI